MLQRYLVQFVHKIFLTFEPLVGIPMILAELSTRQDWRSTELYCHEYIQIFDIHCVFSRNDCRKVFFDTRTVSTSASARIHDKCSFLWLDGGWLWKTPGLRRREERDLFLLQVSSDFVHFICQIPCCSAGGRRRQGVSV